MLSMLPPRVQLHVIGEGGVAKQAVEFPQVLASDYTLLSLLLTGTQFSEF